MPVLIEIFIRYKPNIDVKELKDITSNSKFSQIFNYIFGQNDYIITNKTQHLLLFILEFLK